MSDDTATLTGYAAVFDSETRVGGVLETVKRGAFTRTLKARPDAVLRFNHEGAPLARTTSGTLSLTQDDIGLRYEARLDRSDPDVQALIPKVARGDLRESSFAFRVFKPDGDSWSADGARRELRSVDIDRGDVSLCTFGAYRATGEFTAVRGQVTAVEYRAAASASGLAIAPGRVLALDGREIRQLSDDGTGYDDDGDENQQPCPWCDGVGWVGDAEHPCLHCAGTGVAQDGDADDQSPAQLLSPFRGEAPPGLTWATLGARESCSECWWYDGRMSTCGLFDGYHVQGGQTCDAFRPEGAGGPSPSRAARRRLSPRSESRRDRTDAQVQALGKKGLALEVSPGRYGWPIVDRVDLKAAVQSFGRAGSSAGASKVRAWITQRARALNALSMLPQAWGVSRSDSSDLLAALHRANANVPPPTEGEHARRERTFLDEVRAEEPDPDQRMREQLFNDLRRLR